VVTVTQSRGRTTFFGPVEEAPYFFESLGFSVPLHSNPADYFMTLINTDFDNTSANTLAKFGASQKAGRRNSSVTQLCKEIPDCFA
jgi:hypothetical protein